MKRIDELSGESRIWIYQCERVLNSDEEAFLSTQLSSFIDAWSSHGAKMDATAEVFHHRFLVIGADENQATASGCGIDKSVNFVKSIGQTLHLDFFKRTQIVYWEDNELVDAELNLFWARRKAGLIQDSTIVFDNTIRKVSELKNKWKVPFSESWHAEMWLK